MSSDNNKSGADRIDLASVVATAERELNTGNYEEASHLATQVQQASDPQSSADRVHRANALIVLSAVARFRGDYAQSLEDANAALRVSEEADDMECISKALASIGVVYWHLSDYAKALEYHARALALDEEHNNKGGLARDLGNIGIVHDDLADYEKALEYYSKALEINEELGNKAGVAINLVNISVVYWNLSDYAKSIEYCNKALAIDEELGNKAGVAAGLNNIGLVHMNLSDFAKALEYFGKALALNEELGSKEGVAGNLSNIANVHMNLSDFAQALKNFDKSLALVEEVGNKAGVSSLLGNIGIVHMSLRDYSLALEYLNKSQVLAEELGNKKVVAGNLDNIGFVLVKNSDYASALENYSRSLQLYEELGSRSESGVVRAHIGELYANPEWQQHDAAKAEEYLREAIAINEQLGTKKYEVHKTLSELYAQQERWKESREQLEKFYTLEKEVQSEEAKQAALVMEQRKQIAEREIEIALEKIAADAKLNATTSLLHKVLPPSIALRMIEGEEVIADYFPQVSILFADIVGFTPIASRMPARSVIAFLNFVFNEFDRIMEKHGCQKIKTIGDGYMAVAGAPEPCDDHAERIAGAAIELMNGIILSEEIRKSLPKDSVFHLRIGLHTGSAFAGIVGEKGFVYDVYSDAVNLAARMESQGQAGRIHCSQEFAMHVQNRDQRFVFEERGEIEIKGKGMMRTYFLERL